MNIISKELFYERIGKDVSCSDVHVWNKNCFTANLDPIVLRKIIKGSATFFLPIYLIKMILNYKRKKKNLIRTFIEQELRAILYGISLGSGLIAAICILRKMFGRLHYYTLLFLPGFLSAPSILLVPYPEQILNTLIFFNSFVETIINKLYLTGSQKIVLFMVASGFLMHLLENRTEPIDFTYFWFYTPPITNSKLENVCQHEEHCQQYYYNGIINYFVIGYGVNITKGILAKFKLLPKNPRKIFDILFNRSNVDFGLFIGAYVGVYRYINCFLLKSKQVRKKWHGLISGVLAGVTYTICPTLQVSVLAITTILQILYHTISKKMNIKNHFYQRVLLFGFVHGYNLHNKFFLPPTSSPYYYKMLDACSDNLTTEAFGDVADKYLGT